MPTNQVLAKLAIEISANSSKLGREVSGIRKDLNGMIGGLTKVAGAVGIAFGVSQVASFATEIAKVAGEADGVRAAFDRLPESTKRLNDLRNATGDTVSELELMKRTVQASNFGISLQSLPKLLEFAAVRAQQTGESVDYLVNSIITGIGRKSALILDNLGISAVRLKDEFNGASLEAQSIGDVAEAVGRIAEQELSKMGGLTRTTATRFQELTAAWENFKESLGSTETGFFNILLDAASQFLRNFGTTADRVSVFVEDLAQRIGDPDSQGIDAIISKLADLRQELEAPIEINIQDLAKRYQLTDEEADRLYQTIQDINSQLSLQETRIKLFKDFAKGYEDVTRAAEDFNQKQYDLILAAQIERVENDRLLSGDKEGIAIRDSLNKQLDIEITSRRNLVVAVNAYVEALKKEGAAIVESEGVLEKLNRQLKEAQESKNKAFSVSEIIQYNKQIEDLQKRIKTLNELSNPKAPDPIEIPVTFDIPDILAFQKEATQAIDKVDERARDLAGSMEKLAEEIATYIDQAGIQAEKASDKIRGVAVSGAQFAQTIENLAENAIVSFADAFGDLANGADNFGYSILQALASLAKQIGGILVATGLAMKKFRDFAITNPELAVAAGAALIAAASVASQAISAARDRTFSGGGGSGGGRSQTAIPNAYNGSLQDSLKIEVVGQSYVKGQDIWIAFKEADRNNNFRRFNG